LLGELALHVPVAVEAVALAVFEVGFGGLLAVVPPFLHDAVHLAVHIRILAGDLLVGVLATDESGVGAGLVAGGLALIGHLDIRIAEVDLGGLFFAGDEEEAERGKQGGKGKTLHKGV
ncbi:MAG: hypothetical protein ACK56I_14095, partial [bacterium]